MLEIKNLRFSYSGRDREVLRGVDLSLSNGEIGVLLGRNGAGKSTLFSNLSGVLKPSGGSVSLDGADLLALGPRARAKLVSVVPQDIRFGALSVFDTVLLGRLPYFGVAPGKADRAAVERTLEETGLSPLASRLADRLSGGEKQKVAIARAVVGDPKLLVLDEPTANLDLANEKLVVGEIRRLAHEKGVAVLVALHDINRALELGDKFFFMKDGIVIASGGEEAVGPEIIKTCFDSEVRVVETENIKIII